MIREILIGTLLTATLAVIAVPNFTEVDNRSKVARARAELKRTAVALESYKTDTGLFPPAAEYPYAAFTNGVNNPRLSARLPSWLTTPVAYINYLTKDPFVRYGTHSNANSHWYRFIYFNYDEIIAGVTSQTSNFGRAEATGGWLAFSYGPDQAANQQNDMTQKPDTNNGTFLRYDPTNGALSWGNLVRTANSEEGFVPAHPLVISAPKGPN